MVLSHPHLPTMKIEQPYGSMSVVDPATCMNQSADYPDPRFQAVHDHDMGTPSTFNHWSPSSSMTPSTPAFQFENLLEIPWLDSPTPQPVFPTDIPFAGTASLPSSYPEEYTSNTITPQDHTQLPHRHFLSASDFLQQPGITNDPKPEDHELQQIVQHLSNFFTSSPPNTQDDGTAPNALPGSSAVQTGTHGRAEEERPQPRGYPMHSYESPVDAKDVKKNPEAMRQSWIDRYFDRYGDFVGQSNFLQFFSKRSKQKVATMNTLKASAARRKVPAKFWCPIEECGNSFTRKHNLENHLKSHCGVTDRICNLCGKGFTTIPVWKRHKKSCGKGGKAASTKGFLDAMMAQPPA